MSADLVTRLVAAAVSAIRDNAEELTALDRAIGDGDHGLNMRRGFDAVEEAGEVVTGLALPAALEKIGMILVMKVGGASGPLYGSLFMAMGKSGTIPDGIAGIAGMLAHGIDSVKKRGKSTTGEKTMLDVLVPVHDALAGATEPGDPAVLLAALRAAADAGLESTRPMKATKGRASFLGDRSIGHFDPGARSSQLLVRAVCDVVEQTPAVAKAGAA